MEIRVFAELELRRVRGKHTDSKVSFRYEISELEPTVLLVKAPNVSMTVLCTLYPTQEEVKDFFTLKGFCVEEVRKFSFDEYLITLSKPGEFPCDWIVS